MQRSPPDTTDTAGLNAAATSPASRSPRRGPPVTTRMWIPESRPRSESGTESWRIVLRKTAEITSAAPAKARNASASHRWSPTRPKAAIPAHPARRERAPERAHGGRGEQQPGHLRAGVELRCREEREQRSGHAEDHCHEVDEKRRLEHPPAFEVGETLLHRGPSGRGPLRSLGRPRPD